MNQTEWMEEAFTLAAEAAREGEIPVGAVVVNADGTIIGRGRNCREAGDPLGHAEVVAIREAAAAIDGWRLDGTTIVVTLEPCAMCAGAIVNARIPTLIFAAWDPKAGYCGSLGNIVQDPRLNHRVEVQAGVQEQRSREMLQEFFQGLRGKKFAGK